jgi:hypothetical protein
MKFCDIDSVLPDMCKSGQVVSAWFELLLVNFLTLLLVSIAMNLSFYLLHQLFDTLNQNPVVQVHVLELIPVILLSVLSFFMIKRCVSAAFYMGSKLVLGQGSNGFSFGVTSTVLKTALRLAK